MQKTHRTDSGEAAWSATFSGYELHSLPLSLLTQRTERPSGQQRRPRARDAFSHLWDPAGRRSDLAPAVPLGASVASAEGVIWRFGNLTEEQAAQWRAAGIVPAPCALLIEGSLETALLLPLDSFDPDKSHPTSRNHPFARVRQGEVERFWMEGGFEEVGFLLDPVASPSTPVTDAEALRRAVGHGLRDVSFRDASDAWLRVEEVVPNEKGFVVRLFAISGGRSNQFELTWTPDDGDPRAWVLSRLQTLAFEPGSEEWIP